MNTKVVLKYAAIHSAELGILALALLLARHFWALPTWAIVAVIVLAVCKDIVFFPKVWKAYAGCEQNPLAELVGMQAEVIYRLGSVAYVLVRGELWRAVSAEAGCDLRRGERVRVVGSRGMTLIVERATADPLLSCPP